MRTEKETLKFRKIFGIYTSSVVVAALAIIAGIAVGIYALNSSFQELEAEHNGHMQSITLSADRNLASLFKFCRQELHEEARMATNLSVDDFMVNAKKNELLSDSTMKAIAVITDGKVRSCTNSSIRKLSFYCDYSTDNPCICTDNNNNAYIALIEPVSSPNNIVVGLLNMDNFFKRFAGMELSEDYWMALYDMQHGLCIQNNQEEPFINNVNYENAIKYGAGLGIMARSEQYDEMIFDEYSQESKSPHSSEYIVTALPQSHSENGYYAIGLAIHTDHYTRTLTDIFLRTAICGALILFGILVLFIINRKHSRVNQQMRANISLLNEQNARLQELLSAADEFAHQQRLVTIGTLASSANHEFSNLLTPILGYSVMAMEKAQDDEEMMDYLEKIYLAASKSKELVARFLRMSRRSTIRERVDLSPDELLENVEKVLNPSRPHNVKVITDYNCPDKCLYAYETEIEQVMINLILNAFQAMKNEGGTLTISTSHTDEYVNIVLADNGPGIPEEIKQHIFEPFYTTKEEGSGTGLGLSIVNQIIEAHHGRIELDTVVGQGTTFRIILPIY
ncbi:MAG: HAMP domain-containing histidine kinase [Clostridiales bacterium]|nr:HAMP domain-containing histidine kinase [Candidatus Crickella equi]